MQDIENDRPNSTTGDNAGPGKWPVFWSVIFMVLQFQRRPRLSRFKYNFV